MTQRYIVQSPDLAAYNAAQALEVNHLRVPVAHANRRFISVDVPPVDLAGAAGERYAVEQLDQVQKHYKAALREEVQFDLEARDIFDPAHVGPDLPGTPSLDDVLQLIHADEAWTTTRGKDANITIS